MDCAVCIGLDLYISHLPEDGLWLPPTPTWWDNNNKNCHKRKHLAVAAAMLMFSIAKMRRLLLRLVKSTGAVLVVIVVVSLLLMMVGFSFQGNGGARPLGMTQLRREKELEKPDSFHQGAAVNFMEEECEMCDKNLGLSIESQSDTLLVRTLGQEEIQLYRHYTGHEPWPAVQLNITAPGMMPTTVHYLWCQNRYFGFNHYLSVLSAVRILKPLKLVFHYKQHPPLDHDMYYSWLIELKQSFPYLVFQPLPEAGTPSCDSSEILNTALSLLQQHGGIFLGSNIIISRLPRDLLSRSVWFAFSPFSPSEDASKLKDREDERKRENSLRENLQGWGGGGGGGGGGSVYEHKEFQHSSGHDIFQGIIFAKSGFSDDQKQQYLEQIRQLSSSSSPSNLCVTKDEHNQQSPDSDQGVPCVYFPDKPDVYPVDIMYEKKPFAQLARWLFYGTRRPMFPKTKVGEPIPRITHLIWFSPEGSPAVYLPFYQYLTILSALYVAGFHHVYIHGNGLGFQGQWWEDLSQKENVTFVHLDPPEVIYQQEVKNPSHMSDVTRYGILHQYGGAYQDFEAMWTQRIPDWLLEYPCVATSDWAAYGDFPDGINPGVLLGKKGAPWLRYNLASHRYYIENNFVWNAVLMTYRTFERHPDQLYYYRHLQVMCDFGVCHPSWEPGFRRDIEDKRPTMPFDWRTETLAVHVTRPEPEVSLTSPETLRQAKDMFAEIGRNILTKSGRSHLLRGGS